MRLRADFDRIESVPFDEDGWAPSPAGGVDRFMLDRIGDEVARATSIVRYAPNSRFPTHQHDLGEEFLVLDGVFSDASGNYASGSYVRNPPGTQHAPWTDDGCVIFVKLRQFLPGDLGPVALQLESGDVIQPLHRYQDELVDVVTLSADGGLSWESPAGGCEILVFDGDAQVNGELCHRWHWLRFPAGQAIHVEGAGLLYRKQGHLPRS